MSPTIQITLSKKVSKRLVLGAPLVVLLGLTCVDLERWQGLALSPALLMIYDLFFAVICLSALSASRPLGWAMTGVFVSLLSSVLVTIAMRAEPGPLPSLLSVTELGTLIICLILVIAKETVWRALIGALAALVCTGLVVFGDQPPAHPRDALAILAIAVAIVLAGLCSRLEIRARKRATTQALDDQRLEIARQLHDSSARALTGVIVQVQALRQLADARPDAVVSALPQIEAAGKEALNDMRKLTEALRHDNYLPDSGPGWRNDLDACCLRAKNLGLPVEADISLPSNVCPETGSMACAIVGEGLTNALRYATDATLVKVDVKYSHQIATVEVFDNGVGQQVAKIGSGYGIAGLRERVQDMGGQLTADRDSGGWKLFASIPDGRAR